MRNTRNESREDESRRRRRQEDEDEEVGDEEERSSLEFFLRDSPSLVRHSRPRF